MRIGVIAHESPYWTLQAQDLARPEGTEAEGEEVEGEEPVMWDSERGDGVKEGGERVG